MEKDNNNYALVKVPSPPPPPLVPEFYFRFMQEREKWMREMGCYNINLVVDHISIDFPTSRMK